MLLIHLFISAIYTATALGAVARVQRGAFDLSDTPPSAPGPASSAPLTNVTRSGHDDLTDATMTPAQLDAVKAFSLTFKPNACAAGLITVTTIPVFFHHVCLTHPTALRPFVEGVVLEDQQRAAVARLNQQFSGVNPRFKFVWSGKNYMTYDDSQLAQYQRQAVISDADFANPTTTANKLTVLAKSFRFNPGAVFPPSWTKELHIYTLPIPSSVAGFAYRPGTSAFAYDGVYLQLNTLIPDPATGRPFEFTVLAHEVGHWLGLRHTFDAPAGVDSCTVPNTATAGDFIVDTIKWKNTGVNVNIGCPVTGGGLTSWSQARHPCTGSWTSSQIQNGIANFMSYSRNVCRTLFTPGQLGVMLQTANGLRKITSVCSRTA